MFDNDMNESGNFESIIFLSSNIIIIIIIIIIYLFPITSKFLIYTCTTKKYEFNLSFLLIDHHSSTVFNNPRLERLLFAVSSSPLAFLKRK